MKLQKYILIIFLLFFHSNSFAVEETISQLIFIKGTVELHTPRSEVLSLSKGDSINEGDEVTTGSDSFAILRLADQNIVKLGPESSFALKKLAPIIEGKSYGITETFIHKGRVFFEVPNEDKVEKLRVTTKTLAFAVRGTTFLVDVASGATSDDDIWLGVDEGEVEVSSLQDNSKHEVVLPSEAMNFEKGTTFSQPQKYDWMKKVNFNIRDQKKYRSGLSALKSQRKSEFKKKRKNWSFNKERFQKRESQWKKRKEAFQKRHKNTLNSIKQKRAAKKKQGRHSQQSYQKTRNSQSGPQGKQQRQHSQKRRQKRHSFKQQRGQHRQTPQHMNNQHRNRRRHRRQ